MIVLLESIMLKATVELGNERIKYIVYGRTMDVLNERANREAKSRGMQVMSVKVEEDH